MAVKKTNCMCPIPCTKILFLDLGTSLADTVTDFAQVTSFIKRNKLVQNTYIVWRLYKFIFILCKYTLTVQRNLHAAATVVSVYICRRQILTNLCIKVCNVLIAKPQFLYLWYLLFEYFYTCTRKDLHLYTLVVYFIYVNAEYTLSILNFTYISGVISDERNIQQLQSRLLFYSHIYKEWPEWK